MPSKAEPVTELRKIKITECGEELIDFLTLCPELQMARPRFNYRRETLLRRTPAEMLQRANIELMKKGFRIQKRMYAAVWNHFSVRHPEWSPIKLKRTVNQFTAPLDKNVPPPHSTGGAVDVSITDLAGNPVDVLSPYREHDTRGFFMDAPDLMEKARSNRSILSDALTSQGLTNYPSEYWHWSYGDQGWAYRGGHTNAIFDSITPEGWTPATEDDTDEPLQFL